MVASEVRLNARKALTSKWGKAALSTLVYMVLVFVLNFVLSFIPVIGALISSIIALPLSYGIVVTFMKLKRGEETTYTEFFTTGFNNFGKAWMVVLRTFLKLIVPIILIFVSYLIIAAGLGASLYSVSTLSTSSATSAGSFGIILIFVGTIALIASAIYCTVKYYLYSLSLYVLNDNPHMTAKEVVEESARLMKGNRWSLFWLQLTFIGWAILACITFGIGYLWLFPYILVAQICFYEALAGKSSNKEDKTKESTDGDAIQEM